MGEIIKMSEPSEREMGSMVFNVVKLTNKIRHIFGRHDVKYTPDEDWGRCTICGKLFCHPPLWWFCQVTKEQMLNFNHSFIQPHYWLYDALPVKLMAKEELLEYYPHEENHS
jgi:hypothetical protein